MWKDIKGYEGCYQVSDAGEVKSLKRHVENGSASGMILPSRTMKQAKSGRGYPTVVLCKNGQTKRAYVHHLVAETFIDNVDNLPTINHKDGNKNNNIVSNLEYMSYAENNKHSYDNGLHGRGENHYNSHLTEEQVLEIKKNGKYTTYQEIADKYCVSKGIVRDILVGETWKFVNPT